MDRLLEKEIKKWITHDRTYKEQAKKITKLEVELVKHKKVKKEADTILATSNSNVYSFKSNASELESSLTEAQFAEEILEGRSKG